MTNDLITFTYAGDSITNPTNDWSWLNFISDSKRVYSRGGVAISGATSAAVLAKVQPVAADVLVVMLGVNDMRYGVSAAEVRNNIKSIIDIVGAKHAVIAAVAPSNQVAYQLTATSPVINRAVENFVLNRELASTAVNTGRLFVDPWTALRRMDGTWQTGKSMPDGVHPRPTTTLDYGLGDRFATYIRNAVEGAAA